MAVQFYRGMKNLLEKLNEMWALIATANSATSPVFQGLTVNSAIQSGNGMFNQAATGNQIIQTSTGSGATAIGMWAGYSATLYSTATLGIITDITFVPGGSGYAPTGGSYAATFSKYKVELFSPTTVNGMVQVKSAGEAIRLVDDAAFVSFWNSGVTARSAYIKAVANSRLEIAADFGHSMRFVTHGETRAVLDLNGNLYPNVDASQYNGVASLRWAAMYAATGAIQTSDARKKTLVTVLTPEMRAAAREMLPLIGTYQWLDSVKEKGADKARLHVGFTVQQAISILDKHGIDPFSMAFICHDKWDAEYEDRHVNEGEKVTKLRIVQKQKTRTVKQPQDVIELINGAPVLVRKVIEVSEPVFDEMPVLHEDGSPVMLDEHTPMLHRVPVMETVQEPYEVDAEPVYERVLVREAGDCFAFRYDQLTLFMLSALAE